MNKKADKKYPSEYRLTPIMYRSFISFLVVGMTCEMWVTFNDWEFSLFFSVMALVFLYMMFQDVEYAVFNHKGLLIVNTTRWGKNKTKEEFYVAWENVRHIKFITPISKGATPEFYIEYEGKGGVRVFYHKTNLSFAKIASLSMFYSGKEDIINNKSIYRRKRKPFEKDW